MKTIHLIISLLLVITASPLLQANTDNDKTGSPYFFVKSDEAGAEQLPLKSTSADVNIAGVIADVIVKQVYKNEGHTPLEAVYVFPGSTRSAVYGMEMQIGERTITAEIREKNQARQEYEAAKREGKRASLLEQERPNVFQMNVANIMPGDEIEVRLQYTELITPSEGVYSFVYPTVVGPRYTGEAGAQAQMTATAHLPEGEGAPFDFDIQFNLTAGMPIKDVCSPTHNINVQYNGLEGATAKLGASETNPSNRDFIIDYELAGEDLESGMLLYEHDDEKFFLLTVQPPKEVKPVQIPPREYLFIVDVSGSMNGFPLDVAKKLMRNLILGLKPNDEFNILLFASNSSVMAPQSLKATPENLEKGINFLRQRPRGSGGTNLLAALNRAFSLPRSSAELSRSMVVVSDGYVSIEKEAFDLIRNRLDESNLFSFGIGSGVNRYLMEGLAHVGKSEPLIVIDYTHAAKHAEKFRQYIEQPVLTQVKADYGTFEVYDVEPVSIPDALAERPIVIFGKYRGEPKGKIKVTGYAGKKKYKVSVPVSQFKANDKNRAIRLLWARERIRLLDDYRQFSYDEEHKLTVTNLGLKYSLMTAYTSFVAIDKVVANESGQSTMTNQPVPLPQGVPNSAVGFDVAIDGVVRRSRKPQKTKWTPTAINLTTTLSSTKAKAIQTQLNSKLKKLDFQDIKEIQTAPNISLELTVNTNGQVTGLKLISGHLSPSVLNYLTTQLKLWKLNQLELERAIKIQFVLR